MDFSKLKGFAKLKRKQVRAEPKINGESKLPKKSKDTTPQQTIKNGKPKIDDPVSAMQNQKLSFL